MHVRPFGKNGDLDFCSDLVMQNWGPVAADRCVSQAVESYNDTPWTPKFCVAEIDMGPVGFAAYQPSMKMKGSFDFIWIAVHPQYQKHKVGTALTDWRIADIKRRGGQMIELVTQKPDYFSRFGFFKLHHLGNEWYLMLKLLANVDI